MKTNAIILGASGHVGQNIVHYMKGSIDDVMPYSRKEGDIPIHLFSSNSSDASILVNCIGVGTPQKEKTIGGALFDLENEWDDKCLSYLEKHPNATYFYFSSGVADERFDENTEYANTKKKIEAKHKQYPYRIFDIRLFSFFSRFIDIKNEQFIPSIIRAILRKERLIVSPMEIMRDYIHPCDLTSSIFMMYNSDSTGGACEVGSSEPVTKTEVLDWFTNTYGLVYDWDFTKEEGKKEYTPLFPFKGFVSSMDTIINESSRILGRR